MIVPPMIARLFRNSKQPDDHRRTPSCLSSCCSLRSSAKAEPGMPRRGLTIPSAVRGRSPSRLDHPARLVRVVRRPRDGGHAYRDLPDGGRVPPEGLGRRADALLRCLEVAHLSIWSSPWNSRTERS